jgi:hypothetical protein
MFFILTCSEKSFRVGKKLKKMKIKSIYVFVLIAGFSLALNSCGGSASGEGGKKTACDCLKEGKDLMAEKDKAMGDEGKMKDLKAKMAAMEESCKDFKPEDAKDCK